VLLNHTLHSKTQLLKGYLTTFPRNPGFQPWITCLHDIKKTTGAVTNHNLIQWINCSQQKKALTGLYTGRLVLACVGIKQFYDLNVNSWQTTIIFAKYTKKIWWNFLEQKYETISAFGNLLRCTQWSVLFETDILMVLHSETIRKDKIMDCFGELFWCRCSFLLWVKKFWT